MKDASRNQKSILKLFILSLLLLSIFSFGKTVEGKSVISRWTYSVSKINGGIYFSNPTYRNVPDRYQLLSTNTYFTGSSLLYTNYVKEYSYGYYLA